MVDNASTGSNTSTTPNTKRRKRRKSNKSSQYNFSAPSAGKLPTQNFTNPAVAGSAAQQSNNSDFVNFLNGISNFAEMTRDDLIEQMYTTEPEIATAVDSFALMVRNSFQFFDIVNYNEIDDIPDTLDIDGNTLDFTKGTNLAKEMIDVANALAKEQDIKSIYEQYAAILKLHGTAFVLINENGSLTILPNDHVTIIDKPERIQGLYVGNTEYEDIITEANYLVLDENLGTQKLYPRDRFMIIRFHDTPVYIEDKKGRITYGIYGVSPMRRAIIPVWYRRILMSNDALWRYKAMPRADFSLDAQSFNTGNYTGTPEVRLQKAQAAASAAIEATKAALEDMVPDQAMVHLNTTSVGMVEPSNATHLDTNGCIEQMTDSIFTAIGLPRSIIQGMSSSNYAGELVIYSHANSKVTQVAEKISRAVLLAMKRKLTLMNAAYPVDLLDIKTSYDLSANDLENFKQAQIMKALGCFTDDEIRAKVKAKPLTDEQKEELEEKQEKLAELKQPKINNGGELGATSTGDVKYPTSSHSANKQPTDSGQAVINKALKNEKDEDSD